MWVGQFVRLDVIWMSFEYRISWSFSWSITWMSFAKLAPCYRLRYPTLSWTDGRSEWYRYICISVYTDFYGKKSLAFSWFLGLSAISHQSDDFQSRPKVSLRSCSDDYKLKSISSDLELPNETEIQVTFNWNSKLKSNTQNSNGNSNGNLRRNAECFCDRSQRGIQRNRSIAIGRADNPLMIGVRFANLAKR